MSLSLLAIGVLAFGANAAWTRFTPPALSSIFAHLGVARTGDRLLHAPG